VVAVAGSAALLRRQERSFPHCSRQGALTHDHLVVGMGSAHAFSSVFVGRVLFLFKNLGHRLAYISYSHPVFGSNATLA